MFWQTLKEALILSLQYLVLYLALFLQYGAAWNVYVFMLFALTFYSIIGCLVVKSMPKAKLYIPAGYLALSDIVISLILAAYGHFFYAALTLVQMTMEQYILAENAKKVGR